MTLSTLTLTQLFDAGVHFGHQKNRWDPRMAPFIFGARQNIHIIDIRLTHVAMQKACALLEELAAQGKRILFVGTKRQASGIIQEQAERCGQPYVHYRWRGGMLTNFQTVSRSIRRMQEIRAMIQSENFENVYTKKEQKGFHRDLKNLENSLGGVEHMGGLPSALIVMDIKREAIAVAEARKLGIPVIATVDTNTNPLMIDVPIPGNDDGSNAILLYLSQFADAILSGLQKAQSATKTPLSHERENKAKGSKTLSSDISLEEMTSA